MPWKWLGKRRSLCYNSPRHEHQKEKCHECAQVCKGERPAYSGLFLFGGGTEIGTPLVRDVAFGFKSSEGESAVVDCRTNSLQLAAANRDPINLAYSTLWATNAASVVVSAIELSGKGGAATTTNNIFMAAADAEGATPMRGVGRGWWRLLYQVNGEQGDTLLEYITDEFKMPGGFILIYK